MAMRSNVSNSNVSKKWILASSSRGTVIKNIYDSCKDFIELIITDRECGARDFALKNNIPHLDFVDFEKIDKNLPILLIGFKKILRKNHLEGRKVYNLHPSFLPLHSGWDEEVHQSVLNSSQKLSAVTLHEVNESVDGGKIIFQFPIPIFPDDTVDLLKAKCQSVEELIARKILQGQKLEHDWWKPCAEYLGISEKRKKAP